MDIPGSVAIVTGGASGLGAGVVRLLTERGGRVAIFDWSTSAGQSLAEELGDTAAFFSVDVTDSSNVRASVDAVVETFARVDLCVNAAGISPAHRVYSHGEMFPLELFQRTLDINLVGAFDVVRNVTRAMSTDRPNEDGERGVIVNVGSIAAYEGQVGQAAYTASKGGIVSLTLQLARDLASWGIRVMSICPGAMDTAMLAGVDQQRRGEIADLHLFPKRLGTPRDFALQVASFAENTLLNGEVVRLDAATRLGAK